MLTVCLLRVADCRFPVISLTQDWVAMNPILRIAMTPSQKAWQTMCFSLRRQLTCSFLYLYSLRILYEYCIGSLIQKHGNMGLSYQSHWSPLERTILIVQGIHPAWLPMTFVTVYVALVCLLKFFDRLIWMHGQILFLFQVSKRVVIMHRNVFQYYIVKSQQEGCDISMIIGKHASK